MSATSPYRLGDKVMVGKNKTVVTVSGIATEKDASGTEYAMVSVESKSGKVTKVESSRLLPVVKR